MKSVAWVALPALLFATLTHGPVSTPGRSASPPRLAAAPYGGPSLDEQVDQLDADRAEAARAAAEAARIAEAAAAAQAAQDAARRAVQAPALAVVSGSCCTHTDAWWGGVAVCEQGGRNDPYFGYFSFMDGSQGGRPWADQVAAGNALLNAVGHEVGPWAASCVAAGYRASPSG